MKNYLVSQGISADKIQTHAEGERHQLSEKQVSMLQTKDTERRANWMMHRARATWLAYNRRVDIIPEPTGQQSTRAFPNDASDARILWQRTQPSLPNVESAANSSTSTASLQAGLKRKDLAGTDGGIYTAGTGWLFALLYNIFSGPVR